MADSSTIGRNFIIAGVVLGLGAAAAGYCVSSSFDKKSVNTDTSIPGSGKITAEAQKVKAAYEAAARDVVVLDIAPEGAWIARDKAPGADGKLAKTPEGKVPRYTPVFFAPSLWLVKEGEVKASMRDLMAMEDPENRNTDARVHKDVPNEWFFRYGLEGIIGDAEALERDTDGDGYTNGEEFAAGTDPTDASKHPAFVVGDAAKMVCVKRHTDSHSIELSSTSDFTAADGPSLTINVYKGAVKNGMPVSSLTRIGQVKNLKPESSFGLSSEPAGKGALSKDRFKIVAATSGSAGDDSIEVEDTHARTEEGRRFTLLKGGKHARAISDVELTLRITAGSAKGKEIDHAVQVGETFSVPGFPGTECTLLSAGKDEIKVKVGDQEVRIQRENAAPKAKK